MGSRFSKAVPGRHIPLLVLCRCCSPSVCSLSVMAYFSGVIAVWTVIQLLFAPPFCFWILGYVWERVIKSRYKKPPTDFSRSRLCICKQVKYVYIIYQFSCELYYNQNIRSCQALFWKILRAANQTVNGGANAKKTRLLKPACMGRLSGAFAVYCQRNRRDASYV